MSSRPFIADQHSPATGAAGIDGVVSALRIARQSWRARQDAGRDVERFPVRSGVEDVVALIAAADLATEIAISPIGEIVGQVEGPYDLLDQRLVVRVAHGLPNTASGKPAREAAARAARAGGEVGTEKKITGEAQERCGS